MNFLTFLDIYKILLTPLFFFFLFLLQIKFIKYCLYKSIFEQLIAVDNFIKNGKIPKVSGVLQGLRWVTQW